MTAAADAPRDEGAIDGRLARRDRNRAAVLDATIALFSEGDLDPAPELVAKRADISPRSVYRYRVHRAFSTTETEALLAD